MANAKLYDFDAFRRKAAAERRRNVTDGFRYVTHVPGSACLYDTDRRTPRFPPVRVQRVPVPRGSGVANAIVTALCVGLTLFALTVIGLGFSSFHATRSLAGLP